MKPGQKVAYGPSHVGDRVIARIVERPDGTAYLETWSAKNPRGWIEGGASFDDFFFARAVPAAMAKMQRFLALVRDCFISKSFNFDPQRKSSFRIDWSGSAQGNSLASLGAGSG
jgi:hypothetical protein